MSIRFNNSACFVEATKPPQCDDKPQNVDPHALEPTESFSKDVGSVVTLHCKSGFKKGGVTLKAECKKTETGASWTAVGECVGVDTLFAAGLVSS